MANYERISWKDYPSTDTPLDSENLNKMDAAIDAINREVQQAREDIENNADQVELAHNRIDSLIALPDGSTTADAELVDARIGYDNTQYNSLGAAIRGQVEDLHDALDDATDELNERLNALITTDSGANDCDPDAFTTGLLNASGVIDTSYTTRITTDFIPVNGTYVSAYCHQDGYNDIGPVRIAFYNSDKTLDRIITVSPAIVLAVNGASFVRASFAENWEYYFVGFSDSDNKVPFEEYRTDAVKIVESALPDRITATDNWLYKFAECEFVGGNVHLSIDDVGAALYELINNPPVSIWDTTFFGQLKTLHDTYGICITCNCFSFLSTISDYDIADVPNTWASEFADAKSWLRFSFHAKNNIVNYSSDTNLKTDYEYFVSAIYNMTGDYDCIDTGVRLSMFAGTKDGIVETMKVAHGITMLWTADDNRNSYYFDTKQTERVNNRGKYIDDLTNLLFVRSMPRLDNHTIDDITPLLSAKPQYSKIVELYCHENLSGVIAPGTITRINNALTWFNGNNYKSHFLADIFK